MNSTLHALPVLRDNVVWIWQRGSDAVVVDPAIAAPVREYLHGLGLTLQAVLQTHHHQDHIGGTLDLLKAWPEAEVVASVDDRDRIPFQTVSVQGGEQITMLGTTVKVIDVAAHTRAHIAFSIDAASDPPIGPVLFCGDTLFAGGCGRLFEGSAADMYIALQRLNTFPADTKVCCAHEYTESNLRWAAQQRPDDSLIAARLNEVQQRRSRGELTLPTTLGLERVSNLFLQADDASALAELREHKDAWQG